MRKFVASAAFAALVALPAMASAQAGGVCEFSGSANLNPPLSSVPSTSPGGYTFSGVTSGPACGALAGNVSSTDGKFTGASACEGNVHGGTASTKLGQVSYNGVCAGPDCSGVGYNTAGRVFQYNLIFDQDTLTRATLGGECEAGTFRTASFDGTAEGGSR